MELFKVVKVEGNKTVAEGLVNKMEAKAIRDEFGGAPAYKVSRGKDNKPSPRGFPSMMRLQPKR